MEETGAEGRPKRLIITEMVLENFKSYAGKQRVGPFHKCFSSVVGPNGSGKSNVIDAMLFVFGKRAKQLRLNKVSELIHNSAGRQNIEQAQVSVYFQEIIDLDDDNYESIPGTDFVVSRTAHRSNKSDYFINDRKSNFTEVTHLLKGKGIDLDHNRFLILQGEVEQISMMKPKAQTEHETGLLEYLEDIIGTNRFIAPLQDSAKRLEEFGEARAGLVARVKIAEKEREALEADKLAAEAYLDKEREARSNNRLLANTFARLAQKNVEKIEANLVKLEEKLAYEKNKSGDFKSTLEEHETRFEGASKSHAMMVRELESVTERFREYERKDIAFREELKHCRNKLTKGAERAQRERAKLETAKAEAAKGTERVPALRDAAARSAAQLEREESKLEAALEACSDEAARIREHLGSARAELAPYESRAAACKASRDEAASERDLLVREREAAQRELEKARRVLAEAEQEVHQQEIREKELVANELQATARLEAAKEALHEARRNLSQCEEKLRHARGRLVQCRSERTGAQSASAVAKALHEARQTKSIPGILGRLGDLGAIHAKYDIAVSSAAPALDNWVVDSTATAQRCVELLRQRALGVATFLILERQRHLASPATAPPPETPEGVPRLFDLVQIKGSGEDADAARLAFYFALRDTLVTADLEQATRIAYASGNRRWRRLVTLNGETVNEAGTLSGGGSKPKGGRMLTSKASARDTGRNAVVDRDDVFGNEDVASLELSAREAETAHRAAQQALTAAEREVDEAMVECKRLAAELPRCRLRIKGAKERYTDATARLSSMESDVAAKRSKGQRSDEAARERRIEELSRIIDASETELEAIAKESVRAAATVHAIEQELEGLGGEPVRRLRSAIAALGADIDAKEAEAARLEAAGAAAAKQVQKLEREMERAARELESVHEKQEKVKHEFKELEEAAFKVLESVNATRGLVDAKMQELEIIKVEYEKRQKEYAIICQVEEEIKSQLDAQKLVLREEAAKERHWRGKAEKADKALLEVLNSYAKVVEETAGKVVTTTVGADTTVSNNKETHDVAASNDEPTRSPTSENNDDSSTPTLKPLTEEELDQVDTEALQYRLTMLQEEMQRMTVNLGAIDAWRAKDAEYTTRIHDLEQATAARDEVRRAHDDLRKQRLHGFMAGFNSISLRLKEMYQMITLGGDAELELVDSLDPFSEGILFSVRPPKKSWKNIANLSGGEKTLSSLSLVFALHHYKPTPLYVMDEIDAALDFKNVSIVGHYIKERTKNAQFVIISLRNNMFELADRLVGIYKTDNATKSVAIDPGAFVVGGEDRGRLIAAA